MEPSGGRIGPSTEGSDGRRRLTVAPYWDGRRRLTAAPCSTSGRILIVDDHELSLKLLERLLELEGHEVHAADSLAAAERALAQERPAMIVLDLNLPDGNGLELTRKLKSEPTTASIPIVACTAGVMPEDERGALAAGCDAYVSKPIDLRRFATVVASMLA